jgi:hypothetical protein
MSNPFTIFVEKATIYHAKNSRTRPYKPWSRVAAGVARKIAKHRSPVMMTAAG